MDNKEHDKDERISEGSPMTQLPPTGEEGESSCPCSEPSPPECPDSATVDGCENSEIDVEIQSTQDSSSQTSVFLSANDLRAGLEPILERLSLLREIKNDVAYNKSKDELIAKLDRQVQEFTRQNDQDLKILKPAFTGIIRVIDAIEDMLPYVRNEEKPMPVEKIADFIDSLALELGELLSSLGVDKYGVEAGEAINPRRHSIVETVSSDDPSHFNQVKATRRSGYEHRDDTTDRCTVIRQAKVSAYKAPRPTEPPVKL